MSDCVYTKRKVSELQAEAERLIATGQMPTIDEFLDAVAEARERHRLLILAARRREQSN